MSAAPRSSDEWPEIVRLVRAYARRKYGWDPKGITIHSHYRDVEHHEPLTLQLGQMQEGPSSLGRRASWDSGPEPQHLSDYRAVYWPGLGTFVLSELQACVVELLWEAMEAGHWEEPQDRLLRKAGSGSVRLRDLFKGANGERAWGVLVVPGRVVGNYRLPELPRE